MHYIFDIKKFLPMLSDLPSLLNYLLGIYLICFEIVKIMEMKMIRTTGGVIIAKRARTKV